MKLNLKLKARLMCLLLFCGFNSISSAAVLDNTILMFDSGVESCLYGGEFPDCIDPGNAGTVLTGVTGGSWFAHDNELDGTFDPWEREALNPYQGIIIGAIQDANGSHSGPPDGTEAPNIDLPWHYFTNTGMHQTTSPVMVVSGDSGIYQLDFSGWSVDFNGLNIPLGGDPSVVGDNGTISDGSGLATITCSNLDCSVGSTFILDYEVFNGDVFSGAYAHYGLHLEGTIEAVPAPAAVWLFCSGLLGLIGAVKKKDYM